ncbi:MAG: nucleotide exchange factor GrpE [Candidatus Liberibacter europaeus]|uniref:Protein GrpE n=1 Tax=Candidatus Liberibacter europaeus TaxID=744859 RepID=A0A2T4VXK7_9HYPH|nr:nucleotide exchange factor GrpE [Candidatus Liberibacter europaeus]PTL86517.1 MAG: nucleotide exchange factor GrpE [Candidatus Liberibacter europaeus]
MNDENIEKENVCSEKDCAPIEEETTTDPIEEAQSKAKEFHEKYIRVVAEMENLRRRTDREKQDIQYYSNTAFARDMLSVADNLSRALDYTPTDEEKIVNTGLKSLIDGIEMTKREMISTLEKHGIKKLESDGKKFDPNFHQAMFEEQNETIPANTIIKVVQDGYTINDRVLRPALVGISKGIPNNLQKKEHLKDDPQPIDNEDKSDHVGNE